LFAPVGAPFELRDLATAGERMGFELPPASYRVVLSLEGRCWVRTGDGEIECQVGQACVLTGRQGEQSRAVLVETDGRSVAASYRTVAH